MVVVSRDSSSLYDELMARGMVATTTGVSRVQVTVIIEYTVPTHCNDGEGVGNLITVRVEQTMPTHGAGIMSGFGKRRLVSHFWAQGEGGIL